MDEETPLLMIPLSGAIMDNGCLNRTDPIEWYFSWTNVQGAEMYELYVKEQYATGPTIDLQVIETQYTSITYGNIIVQNSQNWIWKVRCLIDGKWSDWSPEQTFQVEPIQTDCPG